MIRHADTSGTNVAIVSMHYSTFIIVVGNVDWTKLGP